MNIKDLSEAEGLKFCKETCKICGRNKTCDKSNIGCCLPTYEIHEAFKAGYIKAINQPSLITNNIKMILSDIEKGRKKVLSLDKNFHVYIHGAVSNIGFLQDDKGKFIKIYFENII